MNLLGSFFVDMRHTINSHSSASSYLTSKIVPSFFSSRSFSLASSAFYDYYNRKLRKFYSSRNPIPCCVCVALASSSSSLKLFIYRKTHHKFSSVNCSTPFIHSHTCGVDNEKRDFSSEKEIYAIECTIIIAISYSLSLSRRYVVCSRFSPCCLMLLVAASRGLRRKTESREALDFVCGNFLSFYASDRFPLLLSNISFECGRVWTVNDMRHKCC